MYLPFCPWRPCPNTSSVHTVAGVLGSRYRSGRLLLVFSGLDRSDYVSGSLALSTERTWFSVPTGVPFDRNTLSVLVEETLFATQASHPPWVALPPLRVGATHPSRPSDLRRGLVVAVPRETVEGAGLSAITGTVRGFGCQWGHICSRGRVGFVGCRVKDPRPRQV